jgi:hypothetical protein
MKRAFSDSMVKVCGCRGETKRMPRFGRNGSRLRRGTTFRHPAPSTIRLRAYAGEAEVSLFAVGGPLLQEGEGNLPVSEAIGRLVRRVGAWAYANEQPLRTLLRLSLDPATGVRRPGHRREWIAEALAPVHGRIDPETYNKLSRVLTLLLGIDPVVVMKDIAGASREQALDALAWAAHTLVEGALRAQPRPRKLL